MKEENKKVKHPNKATILSQNRASPSGFHFYNLYHCCKFKFFLTYGLRYASPFISPPLLGGSAFHLGKAVFYRTKARSRAMNKVKNELKKMRAFFQYEDEFDRDLFRYPFLLGKWIDTFGYQDFETYDILGVEEDLSIPLNLKDKSGNPFEVTIRIDLRIKDRDDGYQYIMDTKTSSFSIKTAVNGLLYGDQATTYLWGLNKLGYKPFGLIPDIAYWNKNASTEENIKVVRDDVIMRNKHDFEQIEESFTGTFLEIAQKIEGLKHGYSPYLLFPRNTYYCNAFFKPCEFADICRRNDITKRTPTGFYKLPKSKKTNPATHVLDNAEGLV